MRTTIHAEIQLEEALEDTQSTETIEMSSVRKTVQKERVFEKTRENAHDRFAALGWHFLFLTFVTMTQVFFDDSQFSALGSFSAVMIVADNCCARWAGVSCRRS